jgi:hypothetical protein
VEMANLSLLACYARGRQGSEPLPMRLILLH